MANEWKTLGDHPYIQTKVAPEIEKGYWALSNFDFYSGTGPDRAIRMHKVDDLSPFSARLKAKSEGTGVLGNANLTDNIDSIDFFSQTLEPQLVGNSFESEVDLYNKTKNINFEREARDNLIQWFSEFSDRSIIANLSNDLTNIVCASANHASGIHPYVAGDTIQNMCAKVSAGDVCSVQAIRQLLFHAKNGKNYDGTDTFVMKPTRITVNNKGDMEFVMKTYLLFIDGYQAMQLKSDPEWQAMQSLNHNQGLEHSFCTGFLGKIDGTWIIELPSWGIEAGLLHSEVSDSNFMKYVNIQAKKVSLSNYHGNNQTTSIGLLLGASSCIYAHNGNVRMLQKKVDMGRKTQIGADKILGIRKAVYSGLRSNANQIYDGKDFGVMGFITSRE